MSKMMCLVGAGANPSVSAAALTEDLMRWRMFRDPTGTAEIVGCIGGGENDGRVPFYEWLVDSLPVDHLAKVNASFEDLIHLVEIVASDVGTIAPGSPWAGSAAAAYSAGLLEATALAKEIARQNTSFIAEQSCIHILERALERTSYEHPLPAAAYILQRLKDEMRATLWVFSLNYDTAVTDATQTNWWHGYSARNDGVGVFSPEPDFPRDRDVNIQLHGSIYFGLEFGYSDSVAPLRRYGTTDQARSSWAISTGHRFALDRHVMLTVPMITGRRKADMMLAEPFASYFAYFRQAAMASPKWLLLGYSGRDPHINSVLASAAEKWGDELRVVVCNYLGDDELARPAADGSLRYWLSPDRLETARTVRRLLAPFERDYNHFFMHRRLSNQLFIYRGRGDKFGRVLFTPDGEYLQHFEQIRYWLDV